MEELEDVYRLRYELAGADETIKALRVELGETKEKLEELIKSVSTCTSKLPDGVAFDIANDDIRYQIVCNLIDRNGEHRKIIKDLKSKLAESEKQHLLDEKEWQHYCAYKYIEPQIKGCLDREWQYEKKIDQLKQQLAEKDKELNDICQNYDFQINDFSREIHRLQEREKVLEQQLAEKEKEIERKNKTICGILDDLNDIEDCEFCEKVVTSSGFSNCIANCSLCAENYYNEMNFNSKYNQDKISFCVEQLEKVKNRIESKVASIYKKLDELNVKIVCESTSRQLDVYEEIAKEIDNQIKQLKEMK